MKPTTQLPPDENERIRLLLAKGADPRGIRMGPAKKSRSDRYRSKWESLFAGELEDRKRAGEIIDWRYEELRLLIGRGSGEGKQREAWWKPDFLVIENDRRVTLFEVKGWLRRQDNDRLKVAAERYPWFRFVMVRREGAGWKETIF